MRKSVLGILIVVGTAVSIARQFFSAPQPTTSIAILPFVELGPVSDQRYFVDGLREEIANRLDRSETGITVSSSPSPDFRNTAVSEIARSLRVDAVLQGSIRRTGNRVHATFSLFDASKKSVTWTKDYDLESDAQFALEDTLAQSVAPSITAHLTR